MIIQFDYDSDVYFFQARGRSGLCFLDYFLFIKAKPQSKAKQAAFC